MKMKIVYRFMFLMQCICFAVCLVLSATAQDTKTQDQNIPRASFPEPTWDFGTIQQGEKVSHTFTITNSGSAELVIESIRTSCGCTAVTPTKKNLAPGESAFLETTFDSSGRDGEQVKKVYVMTNDPVHQIFELDIHGNIAIVPGPRISYEPATWDFGLQEIDATPSTTIVIKNEGVADLAIEQIQTNYLCSATLSPDAPIAPGKQAILTISFLPLKNPGVLESYVNLRTNDTTKPNIPVRILGYVKGTLPPAILMTPMEWDFGIVYKNAFEPVLTSFYVRNTGGENLVVDRLKIPYGFETDTKTPLTVEPGKEARILLRLINPFQLGTVQQYLFVYTNDPIHTARRINIYGYIAETKDE